MDFESNTSIYFAKTNKIWRCSVIKYLHEKGLAPKVIHADIVATLRDTAPSYATIKRWAAHFKMNKESLEDDDRCGRLTTAATHLMDDNY